VLDWNEFILVLPRHIYHFSFNLFIRTNRGSEYLRTKEVLKLPKSLAKKAHGLVSLCPPEGTDYLRFIYCLGEPRMGNTPKLTRLCLQVRGDFDEDLFWSDQDDINRTVKISAVTVRSLPKLRILEIWGCNGINAFMFRYELGKDHVTITWRATEDWVTLEGESIQEWAKLAEEYNVGFSVKKEPFLRVTRGGMQIDGKIIYRHLKSCDLAIDPVTLAYVETRRAW
jgi:hypothetical protein